MISHYKAAEVKPLIINIMQKLGHIITDDNIKIWSRDSMLATDVVKGCNWVKSSGLEPVLVYTNKVPLKAHIGKAEGVKVFDIDDLSILAIQYDSDLVKYL